MIAFLRGQLITRKPTEAILQVGGVGYRLRIPLSTYEALPERGDVTLLTTLRIREDAQDLFGFATDAERSLFLILLSVQGVGPTVALSFLSGTPAAQLARAIHEEQTAVLQRTKGVGAKIARRVVTELKERMAPFLTEPSAPGGPPPVDARARDAEEALVTLGYARLQARQAIQDVTARLSPDATIEEIIKDALRRS